MSNMLDITLVRAMVDPAESLLLYTLQYLSSSSHLPISLYHTGGFKLGIKRAGLFATV